MLLQVPVLLVLAGVSIAKDHGVQPAAGVDGAIEHIEWEYSDRLCLDLLLFDCTKHVTNGEEQVCGTDGNTYLNHCVFAHAVCEYHYSHSVRLHVANRGPCLSPAPVSTTVAVVTTTVATPVGGSTAVPAITTTNGGVPASVTTTTTTGTTTTTTMGPTTTNAVHGIMQDVFCLNADSITCQGSDVDVICATNGVLYPNQCEFAKEKCKHPSLAHADKSTCASPGGK